MADAHGYIITIYTNRQSDQSHSFLPVVSQTHFSPAPAHLPYLPLSYTCVLLPQLPVHPQGRPWRGEGQNTALLHLRLLLLWPWGQAQFHVHPRTGCSEVLRVTKAQDGRQARCASLWQPATCPSLQGTQQHPAYQQSSSRLCILSGLIPVQPAQESVINRSGKKMEYELRILNPHTCQESNKFGKMLFLTWALKTELVMSREEAPKSTVLGKDWKGPLCIRSGYLLFRHCSAFYFSHRYTCLFLKAGLGF